MISFKATIDEAGLIEAIAARAYKRFLRNGSYDKHTLLDVEMAVTACNANGCPLRLEDLERADDTDFFHDILGILNHIDTATGKLKDNFVPLFARAE